MRIAALIVLLVFIQQLTAQHYYLTSPSVKQKYKVGVNDRILFVLKKDSAHFNQEFEKRQRRKASKNLNYSTIKYMNDTCLVLKQGHISPDRYAFDTIRWDELSHLKIHKPYMNMCRVVHSWMYVVAVFSVTSPLLLLTLNVPLSPGFFVVYLLQAPAYILSERILRHYLYYDYYFNLQQWKITPSGK